MTMARILTAATALLLLVTAPSQAEQQAAPGKTESSTGGIFSLIPADSTSEHTLKTPSGDLAYEATVGSLDLFGQDGQRSAKIVYTAYTAKDAPAGRPVTFAFNGGPGAASAYLHLGLLGPKVLDFGPKHDDGTTPVLHDNPDSWLAFTDLVMIDPIGTGWSRAASSDQAKGFYGVRADADSLAKAIALYVQKNDKLGAPKYLLGESYGGFRAAKVASALKDRQSMLVSGIVMLSPLIEGRFLANSGEDPLSAALQLPSLAAAAMQRDGRFSSEQQREAEHFAMTDYLVALAGPGPAGTEADSLYARIAGLTGIPKDDVARTRGFVGRIYDKEMAGADRIVSPYDAAYSAPDAYPQAAGSHNDDPILDGYTRAYGAAFASYARRDLGFACDMTYELLNGDVNRSWDWNDGHDARTRSDASASGDIADLLSVIPTFRLLIAHGYSDALTPYGVSQYVLDHLPRDLAAGSTALKTYKGGHMFYTDPASRQAFSNDMRDFFEGGKT
ncbi:Serine carboxypeptidase [Hartmannibacter diazotrophicus]|uniref:Serine carboxypeptidase n=1 Tax=Hartmannibacter diazotrophicus TaxID=1482074 RepID=A0A2C9D2L1_9HYPH|nr:carboxypeptidase [Hartmannibacter diazotrophicus]SON54388.1 Serine carboxypeptidase [Hartmannibacter diazotrophicus]